MFVTYTPEGEQSQAWEFNPGRIRVSEAEMMQKRFGGSWEEFTARCMSGDVSAHRVLLWHLLRRVHHTLRFEDVPDFYLDELKFERSKAELAAMRDQVANSGKLDPATREQMLMGLDMEIEKAPGELGKATSSDGD